jgi:hypothetical protein
MLRGPSPPYGIPNCRSRIGSNSAAANNGAENEHPLGRDSPTEVWSL